MFSCPGTACCDAAIIGAITGFTTGLFAAVFLVLAATRRRGANKRKHWLLAVGISWLGAGWWAGFEVRGCYVVSLAIGFAIVLVPLLFVFIQLSARAVGSKGPG